MGISLVIKRWVSLASHRIVTNLLYLKYSGYECIHVIELEKNSQQQRIKRFPCSMVTTRSMFISVSSGRETKTKPRWKAPFTVSQCNFRQLSSPCELAEWTNNMWEDIHSGSHFKKKKVNAAASDDSLALRGRRQLKAPESKSRAAMIRFQASQSRLSWKSETNHTLHFNICTLRVLLRGMLSRYAMLTCTNKYGT